MVEKFRKPHLLIQYPFWVKSDRKSNRCSKEFSVAGEGFAIKSANECGLIEQDVFNCLLAIYCKKGKGIASVSEISEFFPKTANKKRIGDAVRNIAATTYHVTINSVYNELCLLKITPYGKDRTEYFEYEFAAAILDQIGDEEKKASYCPLDIKTYFSLPAGLTRKMWEFLENKRRVLKHHHKADNSSFEIGFDKFCQWMPIKGKYQSHKFRTFDKSAKALFNAGYFSQMPELKNTANGAMLKFYFSGKELTMPETTKPETKFVHDRIIAEKCEPEVYEVELKITEDKMPEIAIATEIQPTPALAAVKEVQESAIDRKLSDILTRLSKMQEENVQLRAENAKLLSELVLLRRMPAIAQPAVIQLAPVPAILPEQKQKQASIVEASPELQPKAVDAAAFSENDREDCTADHDQHGYTQEPEEHETETEHLPEQQPVDTDPQPTQKTTPTSRSMMSERALSQYNALTPDQKQSVKNGIDWLKKNVPTFELDKLNHFDMAELADYLPKLAIRFSQETKKMDSPAAWVFRAIEKKYMPSSEPAEKKSTDMCNAPTAEDRARWDDDEQKRQHRAKEGEKLLAAWDAKKNEIDVKTIVDHCQELLKKNPSTRPGIIASEALLMLRKIFGLPNASPSVPNCIKIYEEMQQIAASKIATVDVKTDQSNPPQAAKSEDMPYPEIFKLQCAVIEKAMALKNDMKKEIDELWYGCGENPASFAMQICHICGLNGESEKICDNEFVEDIAHKLIWT